MNDILEGFLRWFWISSTMAIFFGACLYVATRRRELWLRYISAEAAFWTRLGVPAFVVESSRRFEGGRAFVICLWFVAVSWLMLALANGGAYLYFGSQFSAQGHP